MTQFNIRKAIYSKPQSIYTQWWKDDSLIAKFRNKIRMPTPTISIQHSIGSPVHSIQTRKRNKCIQIGREEVSLSLFVAGIILYMILLLLLSRFSRVRLLATPWTAGSSVHGIFQARVLEWIAITFSVFSIQRTLKSPYKK